MASSMNDGINEDSRENSKLCQTFRFVSGGPNQTKPTLKESLFKIVYFSLYHSINIMHEIKSKMLFAGNFQKELQSRL